MVKLDLNKLEVAGRQLDTAIWLFLNEKDDVSIHTLVSAAFSILRDLAKVKGLPGPYTYVNVPQHMRKQVEALIKKPQNFFKHADSDPEERLDFDPVRTLYDIIQANGLYAQLSREASQLMLLYNLWFFAYHKEKMPLESKEEREAYRLIKGMDVMDRKSFLTFLPLMQSYNYT